MYVYIYIYIYIYTPLPNEFLIESSAQTRRMSVRKQRDSRRAAVKRRATTGIGKKRKNKLSIVCSIKYPSDASAAISAQEATTSRADIKTARPALHIYSVDMLAAPAAFAR